MMQLPGGADNSHGGWETELYKSVLCYLSDQGPQSLLTDFFVSKCRT